MIDTGWRQVPGLERGVLPSSWAARLTAAVAVLVVVAVGGAKGAESGRFVVVAGVTVALSLAWPPASSAVAAPLLSGVAAALLFGPSLGVSVGVGLLAALLSIGRVAPPPWTGVGRLDNPARTVTGIGLVIAAVILIRTGRPLLSAAISALGVGMGLYAARRRPDRLARGVAAVDRCAEAIATFVAGALAVLLVGPVLVTIWVGQRIARFDPLSSGAGPGTTWVTRRGGDPAPFQAYSLAEFERHRPGRRRWHARLAALVSLLVVGGLFLGGAVLGVRTPRQPPASAAFSDDPAWPELWAQQEAFNSSPVFDNTTIWRLADYSSPYVNQEGGVRRTWRPPPCTCRRVTVWLFGGSAAWGFFQRDDDTIGSQLARAAWREGIAVDVVNHALPGYSLSQEVQLFAQLTVSEPPPDLAVFYDGANELFLQAERNRRGYGEDESPASYAEHALTRVLDIAAVPRRLLSGQPGATATSAAAENLLDAPDVAIHAMRRYERQVELARRIGDAAGVRTVFVWQPMLPNVPPTAVDEWDPMEPADELWHRRLVGAALAELPPSVIDGSNALDGASAPVMPDFAHTNAEGARLVATDLLGSLRSELVDAASEPAATG